MSAVGEFLKGDTHGIPNWGWLFIIGGGLLVGAYIKKNLGNSSVTTVGSSVPTVDNTPQPDLTPVPPQPVQPPPNMPTYPMQRTVRSAGAVPGYDPYNPGPPVHTQPNNTSPYAYQPPFGSQITVLGPPVTGGFNFGSNNWYPVPGGFISAGDLV